MNQRKQRVLAAAAYVLGAPLGPRRQPLQRADAIVVLGATLRPDGRLSSALEERVRAGVALWHIGCAPIVCMSGGGPPGRVEADAMAAAALALGVPAHALRVEPHARNTAENARFSAALLQAEGCRTVWVVTQPFHLRRAMSCFRKTGLVPLGWHATQSIQHRAPRLALKWILREYAAIAYHSAMGSRAAAGRTATRAAAGLRRLWRFAS